MLRSASSMTNASRCSSASRGESIGRRNAHTRGAQRLVAAGQRVVELAAHALAAEHLGARDAVGVEHERGGAARDERGDAAQRVGLGERALELGLDDRVDRLRLVAAALADGRWRSGSVQPAP